MASKRSEILNELRTILTSSNKFKKVYTASTDISKENSFPVAWIFLDTEQFPDSTLQKTFREITGMIRICTKINVGDDQINLLIDDVITLLQTNYTLNNKCINLELKTVDTDGGVMYPYSIGDIIFTVLTK